MRIKTRFILLLASIFLVILGVSYGMFGILRNDVVSGLGTDFAERQVLYNRAKAMQPLIRELSLARKLADSTDIKRWAANENNPLIKAEALTELEDYRRFFADKSWFFAIAQSGNYYFNDEKKDAHAGKARYTLNPADKEDRWFFGTIESGEPYKINVDYDEKIKVTKVWLNVVVRDGEKALGVIGTGLDLTAFIRNVIASDQPGMSSMFIEPEGAIQAHSDVGHIDFRTIAKDLSERKTIFALMDQPRDVERLKKALEDLRTAKGDEEVTTLVATVQGKESLIGLAYLKEIGWYNLTLLDTESIIGQNRFLPFAVLLIAALFVLSLTTGYFLNRHIVSRISRLDQAAVELSNGNLLHELLPKSGDEMGRLEESFRQMSEKVRQHTARLEEEVATGAQEVAEKTDSLEKASREIKVLRGLLPTCMYCKKIRDEDGHWSSMEEYIAGHSEAEFTHGFCPDCMDRAYADAGVLPRKKSSDPNP